MSAPGSPASWLRRFGTSEAGLAVAIIVVVGLTALLDSNHSYWDDPGLSAKDILRQTVMLGIFALGSAIVIISGGIDLSSGSMIAFAGTTCATIMLVLDPQGLESGHVSTGVTAAAIAGALLVGVLVGTLHAWLITVVGLPPFVATLATLVGLRSFGRALVENVTEQFAGGRKTQIDVIDQNFRSLTTSVWITTAIFAVLAIASWVFMKHTVVGRHLYALGGNEQAARLSGIRTDRLKWLAYCVSAVFASIAGILYIGDQSLVEPQTLGRGYELNAIAAAVVGGCSLQGGSGTIPGTVLGCLFLRAVVDGVAKVIKTGADVYEGLVVGIVVVVAVAVSQIRTSGGRRKHFFPGLLGLVIIPTLTVLTGLLATLMAGRGAGLAAGFVALALLVVVKALETRSSRVPPAGERD